METTTVLIGWTGTIREEGDGVGELRMQPLERARDGAFYIASLEGVLRSTAPLSDYANGSALPSPATSTDPAEFLAYDSVHKVLYASCWSGGVYRYSTP